MLPALPSTTPRLDELALRVVSASAALGKGLHPLIAESVSRLMVKVNSYYTNAMEGNPSKLKDIDAALERKFSRDQAARNFQLEHVAHIKVQEELAERLRAGNPRVCSEESLCWLHERFFLNLPEELRTAKTLSGATVPVVPGKLRDRGLTVGRHEPPVTAAEVKGYLARLDELLSPERLSGTAKLLGWASSHHRLLWIHPFPEGNGRVARLMTTAYGVRIGVGEGLWTVSRAFARERSKYDERLAAADRPRRNDLDGRGPLSEEDLRAFCEYFLEACLDQIGFMDERLRLSELEPRCRRYARALAAEGRLSKPAVGALDRLLLQGELFRGPVRDICRVKARRATGIIKELLDAGVVRSRTPYGPLRLEISADMAAVLFPELA